MSARIQFITHKGKRILVEDFSALKPGAEMNALLDEAQRVIRSQPPKSVLALLDASDASFNSDILERFKKFTEGNTPYVEAAVVVGITGMLQVALTAVARFSGRSFVAFKTRTEALDWLAAK